MSLYNGHFDNVQMTHVCYMLRDVRFLLLKEIELKHHVMFQTR